MTSNAASIQEVAQAIGCVNDPEIHLSVVDLGLIYGIKIEDQSVLIDMTLTSPMCPYGTMLRDAVADAAKNVAGVKEALVNLVWEPVWDPYKMASEDAKVDLGIMW